MAALKRNLRGEPAIDTTAPAVHMPTRSWAPTVCKHVPRQHWTTATVQATMYGAASENGTNADTA